MSQEILLLGGIDDSGGCHVVSDRFPFFFADKPVAVSLQDSEAVDIDVLVEDRHLVLAIDFG